MAECESGVPHPSVLRVRVLSDAQSPQAELRARRSSFHHLQLLPDEGAGGWPALDPQDRLWGGLSGLVFQRVGSFSFAFSYFQFLFSSLPLAGRRLISKKKHRGVGVF